MKAACGISVDWCVWRARGCRSRGRGERGRRLLPGSKAHVHGNVPGHVDVGFVFVHPDLGGSQGVPLGVVIYVVVVGLLGAFDVSHSGTWEDFHTAAALPHLHSKDRHKDAGVKPSDRKHTILSILLFRLFGVNIIKVSGNEKKTNI